MNIEPKIEDYEKYVEMLHKRIRLLKLGQYVSFGIGFCVALMVMLSVDIIVDTDEHQISDGDADQDLMCVFGYLTTYNGREDYDPTILRMEDGQGNYSNWIVYGTSRDLTGPSGAIYKAIGSYVGLLLENRTGQYFFKDIEVIGKYGVMRGQLEGKLAFSDVTDGNVFFTNVVGKWGE